MDGRNEWKRPVCWGRLLILDASRNNRFLTVAARKETESTGPLRFAMRLPRERKAIFGYLGDLTTRIAKMTKPGVRILPNPTAVIGRTYKLT